MCTRLRYRQRYSGAFYTSLEDAAAKNNMTKTQILQDTAFQAIPCRQCPECLAQKTREYATRTECATLARPSAPAWFITLTYNPENLPHIDEKTGEMYRSEAIFKFDAKEMRAKEAATLYYKDIQDFIKRLRKAQENLNGDTHIEYLVSGEYGEHTSRPHYHLCIIGLYIPDAKIQAATATGGIIYTSDWLEKKWDKGLLQLQDFGPKAAGYCAGYTVKKLKGEKGKDIYSKLGITAPFIHMSKKPALGMQYYDKNKDKLIGDTKNGYMPKLYLSGGKVTPLPPIMREQLNIDLGGQTAKRKHEKRPDGSTKDTLIKKEVLAKTPRKQAERNIKNQKETLIGIKQQTTLSYTNYATMKEAKQKRNREAAWKKTIL